MLPMLLALLVAVRGEEALTLAFPKLGIASRSDIAKALALMEPALSN